MTRPTRNWLLLSVFLIAVLAISPRLPDAVSWSLSALGVLLVALSLWVASPFLRARSLLARRDFDAAATELAAFETSLAASAWKRALGSLAVGFHTSNPLAAARNTLGAVRLEQGRLDDARTHFQAALERDPRYGVPFGNLAVLAAMKGDAAGAQEARAKAAALGFKPKLLAQVIADKLAQAPPR